MGDFFSLGFGILDGPVYLVEMGGRDLCPSDLKVRFPVFPSSWVVLIAYFLPFELALQLHQGELAGILVGLAGGEVRGLGEWRWRDQFLR